MTFGNAKVRLFVENPLRPGATIDLVAPQAHYIKTVMRLGHGDVCAVFNGQDGEWCGTLVEGGAKKGCRLALNEQTHRQKDDPDLWLAFAPVKKTRTDFIVEKATELGISRLWPVFTENTISRRINIERMRSGAIEAAEQCGRLSVPTLSEPTSLDALVSEWPQERLLFFLDESGGGIPLADALVKTNAEKTAPASGFLVGPEGGFSQKERDHLKALDSTIGVSLGQRILRSETAVVSALACWQALRGDWRP
jgi:16S rRNA (uracil1498-N3)-methyltransferase